MSYLQCPLQYYFQYELGIAWEKTPSAVVFGGCIHDAVEAINRGMMNGKPLTDAESVEAFVNSWNTNIKDNEIAWKEDPSELLVKGQSLVQLYYDQMKEEKPTDVEFPFRLPIIDPKTGLFIEQKDLVGKIDAIFTDNTIVEIKTSGKSPVQQEIDSNLQVTLYSWAYRMLFGVPEKAIKVISLVKTKEPKMVITETQRTIRDHSWLIATITQVIRAIDQKLFYPNPIGGFGCFNCQYQAHCKEEDDNEYHFLRFNGSDAGQLEPSYAGS
jgi:CRISPR/Cas system-associated exonuclease Cas4 (RecB family)